MSLWRRTAIETFPELHRTIADADDAGYLWFELRRSLEDAYRLARQGEKPLDEAFVADIYEYASWCLHHRSINIRTAVVLYFYEDLVDSILLRPGMARWMSQADFDLLEFAWRYVLRGDEQVKAFQQEFASHKAVLAGHGSQRDRDALKRLQKAEQSAA